MHDVQEGAAHKRLVVCCDGTWNRPDEHVDGIAAPTNVAKIALAVSRSGDDGINQCLYYQRGVGTRRLEHHLGGAFGFGLSRNVRDAYRFLVDNYEIGDEIFLFGFSRGAYTARSTAGLIRNCGILRGDHAGRIREAYALYRSRNHRLEPSTIESRLFRRMYAHEDVTPIRFVGVWDTVGALGIPIDAIRLPVVERFWGFHDTALSRSVVSAYQALAIDEQRGPFRPTLWTQHPEATGQVLEQVWFAGVHKDVGGGYANPALSEIALLWMAERARGCGLSLDRAHLRTDAAAPSTEDRTIGIQLLPDALGELHRSRTCLYRLLPAHLRELGDPDGEQQSAASSALRRMAEMPSPPGYCPPSLERWRDEGGLTTDVRDRGAAPPSPGEPLCRPLLS